jgi:hypothetical protein
MCACACLLLRFCCAQVGAIAGMLKVALGNGHKKYAPIPPSMLPNLNPPPVSYSLLLSIDLLVIFSLFDIAPLFC